MNTDSAYYRQVSLLLELLPIVQQFDCFAIKGGTAINLFVRNMPRLSVDIDLAYLPIEPRNVFLENMTKQLTSMSERIEKQGYEVTKKYLQGTSHLSKLLVAQAETAVKIEPNLVLRGTVFGTEQRVLSPLAQETFLQFQKANIVSLPDLYAGKICAALDRQHPRDLFDIKYLLENEGVTDAIRQAFVVYLASHSRPMNELLSPNLLDQREVYQKEFLGMTEALISYEDLEEARRQLIEIIQEQLTDNERQFLLSMKKAEPDWNLLALPNIETLPALQWKLINIRKMNPELREKAFIKLRSILDRAD